MFSFSGRLIYRGIRRIFTQPRKPISHREKVIGPLSDCLAWCAPLVDNPVVSDETGKPFRSSQFAEAAKALIPDYSWRTEITPSLDAAFKRFLEVRHRAVEEHQHDRFPSTDVGSELRRPKALLLTDWQSALFDGSAGEETRGFMGQAVEDATGDLVTDHFLPPWDTWLALVQAAPGPDNRSILSWVPSWLSQGVDRGIAIDVTECLAWCEVSADGLIYNYGWGQRWK